MGKKKMLELQLSHTHCGMLGILGRTGAVHVSEDEKHMSTLVLQMTGATEGVGLL